MPVQTRSMIKRAQETQQIEETRRIEEERRRIEEEKRRNEEEMRQIEEETRRNEENRQRFEEELRRIQNEIKIKTQEGELLSDKNFEWLKKCDANFKTYLLTRIHNDVRAIIHIIDVEVTNTHLNCEFMTKKVIELFRKTDNLIKLSKITNYYRSTRYHITLKRTTLEKARELKNYLLGEQSKYNHEQTCRLLDEFERYANSIANV